MTANTEIDITTMSDTDLATFAAAAQAELESRRQKRRDDAIARIRAMAGEAGLTVAIEGARGRPPRTRGARKAAKQQSGT